MTVFVTVPSVREALKKEHVPWYWYENIPEEYFARYFIPEESPANINGFDLVQTANLIEINSRKNANPIITTSVWELFKLGYATLEFFCTVRGNPMPYLIASKEYDQNHFNRIADRLSIDYTPASYSLKVLFTRSGKEWFDASKEKYSELFKEITPIKDFPDKLPGIIPEGYCKHGYIKRVFQNDEEFKFDNIMIEE